MYCVTVLNEWLTVALTVKVILQMQLLVTSMSTILFLWILSLCIHFLHTDFWHSQLLQMQLKMCWKKRPKKWKKKKERNLYSGSCREAKKSERVSIIFSHFSSYHPQREDEKEMEVVGEILWIFSRQYLGYKDSSGACILTIKQEFRKSLLIC